MASPKGLVSSAQVEQWATFVASCFAFKLPLPPTREHFLRHYHQDPFSCDPSFIRVIVDGNGDDEERIVATARLVLRPLQVVGKSCWAAGLAEVCVASTHRGIGLAQRVVEDVLAHAATLGSSPNHHVTTPRLLLSVLHCAPDLLSMYGRMGYVSVPVKWAYVTVGGSSSSSRGEDNTGGGESRVSGDDEEDGLVVTCLLDVGDAAVVDEMATVPRPVPGILSRPPAYWQTWFQGEALAGVASGNVQAWGMRDKAGKLLAYAIIRRQLDASLLLLDTGVDDSSSLTHNPVATILQLARAFATTTTTTTTMSSSTSRTLLRLPQALLDLQKKESEKSDAVIVVKEDVDVGWMYRPLPGHEEGEEWKALLELQAQKGTHVIWPIDHF